MSTASFYTDRSRREDAEKTNESGQKKVLLEVKDLSVRYGSFIAADHVSFSLEEGQWMMLVGPNGAGKSTIVQAITRGVPFTGEAVFLQKNIREWKSTVLARSIGVLAQHHAIGYAFRVEEVVRMGRYAYRKGLLAQDDDCEKAVDRALEMTGLTSLRRHSVLELSGGEMQRMFLAQVFAQDPRVLLLDEPTNHLDLIYQKQIFELIREWIREEGRAVLSVVHDLSLARAFGTHALLLKRGKTVALGRKDEVLDPENLKEAYEMDIYAWMRSMLSQWEETDE